MGKLQRVKWAKGKLSRDKWLKLREELQGVNTYDVVRFGSSDVSTIMGENKWSSRKKLFWNLLGMYVTEFNSFKLEMGQRYEEVNRESFECYTTDREGFDDRFCRKEKLRKLQSPKYFLVNTDYKHSFSSLDFILPKKSVCLFTGEILSVDRPVETKFVNYNSYSSFKGKPPMYYSIQVHHQMMIMGSDAGYLSIIAGGDYYDCFYIERDEELITRIDEACKDFQTRVLKAKSILKMKHEELASATPDYTFIETLDGMINELEPEPTASDLEFVSNEMFPETNDLEMKGNDADQDLIDRYIKANEQENQAKNEKTIVRTALTTRMQTFEVLKTDSNKVINRRSVDGRPYFSVK